MSRYTGSRFDGDRRSRSPCDRSPYGDRGERGPPFPDPDRRRLPPDGRGGFQSSRDGYRDSLMGIQPPRGPKALLDPPSGPRGGGFAGDFRGGRGRGGGRGRQWRDDMRDGGRDRDDYRDRPHFRDERSRERERLHERERERERDWQRDQRDRIDFPRGRRPSPPPLRARSPPPGRDFRDLRDAPLGVDAERARRGSRDGPLSAGSSNSDPMFAPSPFRGGFGRGGGRGGGRGRGDWDQRGGRDRGNLYDDRDRYPRSRSQESRWGREQDDRERRDSRYPDTSRDLRDDRDIRDRENRERELLRPKPDRVSHEPPSAKDVSPPPLAPSAPAFGSVPSRQSTSTEIQSLTGKPPPTGPRALTEERPVSAGHGVANERPPPTGPSKPALPDVGPPIPLGPRAQQQKQQRSSKQWINPTLTVKKVQVQESPKSARSQHFPPQARPLGGYPPHADYHRDFDKRPRSPGARSDSHYGAHVATGPNEIVIKSERGSQSARTSVDRETRTAPNSADFRMGGMDPERFSREQQHRSNKQEPGPVVSKPVEAPVEKPKEEIKPVALPVEKKPTVLAVPSSRIQLPPKEAPAPVSDESSESDDDEDMDVYFEREIAKTEAELKKLKDAADKVPMRIVKRYATAVHEALLSVLNDPVDLMSLVGPIPEDFTFPRPKPGTEVMDQEMPDAEVHEQEDQEKAPATREPSAIPTVEEADESLAPPPEPQPKVEEMDTEGSGLPPVPTVEDTNLPDEDVDMQDAAETLETVAPPRRSVSIHRPLADGEGLGLLPSLDQPETERSTASPDEESEDRTEDDVSIYGTVEVVREFSATPPTEDLPIYNVKPWFQSRRVRKLADKSPEFGDFLLGHIRDQAVSLHHAQEEAKREYAKNYESYLRFTMSDDPAAVKSREYFVNAGTQQGSTGKAASSDSKPEGGRRAAGRFSTELDLKAAIEESIREHQERKEREERAQKEKYRSDKEAVIPDMFWTDEEKEQASFYDTAGLLPLEKVVAAWQVVPHHINFTQEEAERFERAYLEAPKQWGKISKEVGRDPGTCIMYYYAMKRELNLKDKLKKQPKRRRKGRGKQRSSALVSELGNTENETEDTGGQDTGDNGERRRPPRRAAAPVWGNDATPNADSDGATPAPTPGRRRAGTAADAKNEAGAEKPEPTKRGGRKPRQPRADKEAKVPKQLAQAPPGGAPLAVPAKTGRSRANSKAQAPDWVSPQTPVDLAARMPLPYEVPHGAMQPPLHPVQQPPLTSTDRAMPPIASAISEVMAPPSLRPEPPPLPPASVPTFEIAQPAGPERIRTPQQASSYWSVSETTDFPGLLRAFGTDWVKIANYMQTKTATMVKNYYVRQTKEGGKPEWEQIAMEADAKAQRGEKRPAPPTPTQGPRKRYDVSTTGHRPLAAAEPDEALLTKMEPQNQPFSRFQVPIAQAAPVSHPLVQPAPSAMSSPLVSAMPAPGPAANQGMSSPHTHPLRPPAPVYTYPEREAEAAAQAQQPVRISQKSVATSASMPPISEPVPRPAAWATDLGQQFSLLSQSKEGRLAREARERQRLDLAQRESPRPVERAPLRMKQEPGQPLHHPEAYPQFQPSQRVLSSRVETTPLGRQPEQGRTAAAVPQSYAPPVHAQPMRSLLGESVPGPQASHMAPNERPLSSMQRQPPVSMQDQYGAVPVSAPPPPQPQPQPAPPRAPERKVNIMSLLNDDEPPPPKRVADIPAANRSSTPQPQPMARQPPPTSAAMPPRREVEPGYPYARNPAPGPQSAIPPLKPYDTQSPQPGHMRVPSTGMASSMDPGAEAQRDYYARHPYAPQHAPQHSVSATKSPQTRDAHHYGQHVQQHPQQAQMGYQGQQYQPYQVSQPHTASPTTQYAPHPSMSSRREAPAPSGREAWPPQQQQAMHQHQQLQQPLQPQQQPHHQHQQHPSQSGWPPSHQAPPKTTQPVPAQSAWGAQHGGVQAKPAVSSPHPPQQHHTWPTSGPSQQQPHPLSLRDSHSRGPSVVYESQSPTAGGMSHHPHHQHHNSLGGGRYAPGPGPQDAVRRIEPQPMPQQQQQQQVGSQPPYARYANTPGPTAQQARDSVGVRSYTPGAGGGFEHRGPPPPSSASVQQQQQQQTSQQQQQYVSQQQQQQQQQEAVMREREQQMREAQMREREQQMQMREAQMREMQAQGARGDPRDQSGGGAGGVAGGMLGRQLRPGPPEGPPGPGQGQGQAGGGPPGSGAGAGVGLFERGERGRY